MLAGARYWADRSCSEQEEQKQRQQAEVEETRPKQRWKERRSEGLRSVEGRQKGSEPLGHREHRGQDCSTEGRG